MKYYGRKALALVLSAILIASTASTAFAQDPVEKDEVVYINLSHDGSVESIYVVNAYDLTEEQPVTDFGNYREVKNLTTTEELSVQDGAISFTAPKGPHTAMAGSFSVLPLGAYRSAARVMP